MPPESMSSEQVLSTATDVFMLGGILYKILTGKAPYEDSYYVWGAVRTLQLVTEVQFDPIPAIDRRTGQEIPEELIEIANKALQKKPVDRYSNAGAFVEALSHYQRSANLNERLRKATVSLDRLKESIPVPQKGSSRGPLPIMEMVENANEFRLIRKELDVLPQGQKETKRDSTLYGRVAQSEWLARSLLIESSMKTRDYSLVESQIVLAEELSAAFVPAENTNSYESRLQSYRQQLKQGRAAQYRDRMIKWLTGIALAVILILTFWGLHQKQRIAKSELQLMEESRQHSEAQRLLSLRNIREQITAQAQTAQSEHFGQGEVCLGMAVPDISGEVPPAWRTDIAWHSRLQPDKTSSCKEIVDSLTFAGDGRSFAALTKLNESNLINIYDVATLQVRDCWSFPIGMPGEQFILANPLYNDHANDDITKSSPYVLIGENGVFAFIPSSTDEKIVWHNLNDINRRAEKNEFCLGRPILLNSNTEGKIIVGDSLGNIQIFSFPEGRLLKTIAVCPDTKGVPVIALSPDEKTMISAGKDGLFKQWRLDGTLMGELPLSLPTQGSRKFGMIRRMDFFPDGNRILVGCESGKLVIWDLAKKKTVLELTEPKVQDTYGTLISRVFTLDDNRFVTFCLNGHYRIWDLSKPDKNGNPEYIELQHDQSPPILGIRSATLSPSRDWLVVAENNHEIFLVNTQNGKTSAVSEGLVKSCLRFCTLSNVNYHSEGNRVLAATRSYHPLLAFDPATLRVTTKYIPYPDLKDNDFFTGRMHIHAIALPDSGKEFAIALGSGDVQFYHLDDPKPKVTLPKCFKKKCWEKMNSKVCWTN